MNASTLIGINSKCPRPFLSFLECALNWTKKQHFDKFYQFLKIVTIQIQIRHVRDHMGKENTIISLMDWKIIMFDHEDIKTVKVIWSLSIFFPHVKSKKWSPKKYELKGYN